MISKQGVSFERLLSVVVGMQVLQKINIPLRAPVFGKHVMPFVLLCGIAQALPVFAAPVSRGDAELQRHQQRQEQREETLEPTAPDVRLLPPQSEQSASFPVEKNCFPLHKIEVAGATRLPYKHQAQQIANSAVGQCLGAKGIQLLMSRLQNMWMERGLVTTRVLAPQQDLSKGVFRMVVVPGILHALKTDSDVNLSTAIPATPGEPLNLRDIEQGLENLQRIPTATADFKIKPAEELGQSDVVVNYKQTRKWRLALSANDGGSKSTGRDQGDLTFYLDSPFGLSDEFYFSRGKDLKRNSDLGSDSYTLHYSIPLDYWLLSFTANHYKYRETVAGSVEDIRYSGRSDTQTLDISRVIQRSSRSKTTLMLGVEHRKSRNFIDDVEVDLQRRATAYWLLGLKNRYFADWGTLDSDLEYHQGTRKFGAQPAPEESSGEATAMAKIVTLDLNLAVPFQVGQQHWRFNSRFNGQWTHDRLTPQEQFTLGGRYTVRGYDGETLLSADKGWYLQNDLAWQIPNSNQELYLGADYGEVSGKATEYLPGRSLSGIALGLKGNWREISYGVFAARAISKPTRFPTHRPVFGFNLYWEY